jgi:hypothetical protein
MCLFVVSCEKESADPVQDLSDQLPDFEVPEIPDEIASLMGKDDLKLFKEGPGDTFLAESAVKSTRKSHCKWHPVLMKLDYHLQICPISSCDTWSGTPCFPPDCIPMGACGFTNADGNWFFQQVHSEYYPIFCFPDYAGHGEGFHQIETGMLKLVGENTPFKIDEDGNSTFRRIGRYVGDQSTGIFEGARGWEIMISYTAAENSPSNSPTGQGQSTVILFGWVYY